MSEVGGPTAKDIGIPQTAAIKEPENPAYERYQAIQARRQLEKTILDKGLIRRKDRQVDAGIKKVTIEDYEVPEAVKQALQSSPIYKEIYGITSVQMLADNSGAPVAEVRLWDDAIKRDGSIHFSVGKSRVGDRMHTIATFPADKNAQPELSYHFSEDENKPIDMMATRPGNYRKMEPQVKYASDRLNRFPDHFKPTMRQKVTEFVGKAVAPKAPARRV